jgi:hypothetical protein
MGNATDETLREVRDALTDGIELPTGAATSAKQDTGNTSLASIDGKLPASLGAKATGSSLSVTRATRVARTEHRASGALAGSGAWSTPTAYDIPDGAQFVTAWITYTRGASGGYPGVRIVLGNGTDEGDVLTVDPNITSSLPYGKQTGYATELLGSQPQDASAITFCITIDVRGGATKLKVLLAEVGVTGTPGTAAVYLTAGH